MEKKLKWKRQLLEVLKQEASLNREVLKQEASLHRELHRSIRQLPRLQQQRKGSGGPWGAPHKLRNEATEVPWNQLLDIAKCQISARFGAILTKTKPPELQTAWIWRI